MKYKTLRGKDCKKLYKCATQNDFINGVLVHALFGFAKAFDMK